VGFCNAQLATFARAADKFGGEDIKIVSVSVDDQEKSEALVEKQARFPGRLRRRCTSGSAATGAFVNDAPVYPEATGFVLNPEGPIVTALYSIGAIGRHDVLCLVRTSYLRQRAEEQRQIGGEVDGWHSRL
jgi:hypothetical protein